MKKWMSLLLAVVMALSLCVTAFAGSDTGARVYLTGDAADEVTGLKNGQRVTGNGDVAVRLNVQSDPEAEEYSVKLNGQTLEADHHTAQYHVYYMPAAALSAKAATLSVNARSNAATPTVTVKVGNETKTVTLPADGSTSASSPTEVTAAEFANPGDEAVLDRIYVSCDDGTVALGTGLSNGKLTSPLVKLGDGYTGDGLYFYKTPAALSKDFCAVWTDGETTRYYKIVVSRGVQSGLALGPDKMPWGGDGYNEGAPGGMSKYESGHISGMVNFYDTTGTYKDGTIQSGANVSPAWGELAEKNNDLYYANGGTAYFARPGFYWLPVTYTSGSTTIEGLLPMEARCNTDQTAGPYIEAAKAVQGQARYSDTAESARTAFASALAKLEEMNTGNKTSKQLYLKSDGSYTIEQSESTGISARNYFGGMMLNYTLIESDINTILDLTAIFTTWGTDATLAGYQWQAYQKLTALGINGIIDVDSLADRDAYQAIRQAKWDLIHTTSEAGDEDAAIAAVNAVLKGEALTAAVQAAGLGALTEVTKQQTEPSVSYGDIDGNGEINMDDVALLIRYCNNLTTLEKGQLAAADLDGANGINMDDVALLIRYCNNLLEKFPVQK